MAKHIIRSLANLPQIVIVGGAFFLSAVLVTVGYLAGIRATVSNPNTQYADSVFCPNKSNSSPGDDCQSKISKLEEDLSNAATDPDFQEKSFEKNAQACSAEEYANALKSSPNGGPVTLLLHNYRVEIENAGLGTHHFIEVDDVNLPQSCVFPLSKLLTSQVLGALKLKDTNIQDYDVFLTSASYTKETHMFIISNGKSGIYGIYLNNLTTIKTISKPGSTGLEIYHLLKSPMNGVLYYIEDTPWGCTETEGTYCKEMQILSKKLADENNVGLWIYNTETEKSKKLY